MSLALVLSAMRKQRPGARHVVWPRVDQKSCLKAISTAGFLPVVVPNLRDGDAVTTDVTAVTAEIQRLGAENVLCVVTTASCFAPREPDKLDEVARACDRASVPHVVNNAYGLQCRATTKLIERAAAVGRVDAIVQSTDKNFLVPVGGSVVCGYDKAFVQEVGKTYPGRASSASTLDLFITLLSMGEEGYRRLLNDREALIDDFREGLAAVAGAQGERLLQTPRNTISFGVTLDRLYQAGAEAARAAGADAAASAAAGARASSFLGSMLFSRCVSGTRVVAPGAQNTINGQAFAGYGASIDDYGTAYFTAACAIGLTRPELEEFFSRLGKALGEAHRKASAAAPVLAGAMGDLGERREPLRPSGAADPGVAGVVDA